MASCPSCLCGELYAQADCSLRKNSAGRQARSLFLLFLKSRRDDAKEDLLPLAQSAWAKDWDKPEEDAAWRDL